MEGPIVNPTKIVVIGAGSAIFGLNIISALMGSQRLRGSQLALVDRNAETLALIARLAEPDKRRGQQTECAHHATRPAHRVASRINVTEMDSLPHG